MDIDAWLQSLGLEQYVPAFREHAIDSEMLAKLTAEDLREIGVHVLGHRKRLLASIAALGDQPPTGTVFTLPSAPDRSEKAERRQLTVMFIDLVGSTALSSQLDPEEMQHVLKAYQNTAAGELARYEGHIAKFMGDGILAYFGWPKAHEDEPERAARAALALVEAVGKLKAPNDELLVCRVGIATGLVVVGDLIGEGAAREEAVVGETPNLAARLQQLAEPGTVIVSDATRRLLEGLFDADQIEASGLKGLSREILAFRLSGEAAAESRFEARQAKTMVPLVGREQELALLVSRWEQAKSGEGQVVLLVGEPGIGKSRIALALRERLRQESRISLRYYGSPYHTNTALKPAIEQLQRAAGFDHNEAPAAKRSKLEALLARAGEEPSIAAPVLAQLLGVPSEDVYPPLDMTPPVLRARTLELLLAQLVGLARQRPVLVMLEDAQWFDPTTREFFDSVIDCIQTLPVLLVVTARPEFVSRWPSYAHVTQVSLNRLSVGQTQTIIERMCGGRALPRVLLSEIVARTDGVPLFVEELTKAVLESGQLRGTPNGFVLDSHFPERAIPTTLHDSLMARLDRLDAGKELAQTAACIGRAFTAELVAAVSDLDAGAIRQGLDKLVAAGLIHPRRVGATESYTFKHALVQELARHSLLKSRRRDLHRRIATAIETRHPHVAEHEPEILAYHYGETELHECAATYRLEAARLAKARHGVPEAIAHLETCLRLDASQSEVLRGVQRDAWLMLGDLASLAEDLDRANSCYDRALALAKDETQHRAVCNRHHRLAFATRNGARLAFYEHGSGEPTIVFVNPIVYGIATFQAILEQLCQEFRVITVDCRGAGRSDALERPYTMTEHVEDLRTIIEAAHAAPIVGVGISRGSNQLLRLTHKHPDLVGRLMIVGTPMGDPVLEGLRFYNAEYLQRRDEAYKREDVEALLQLQAEFVYTEEHAAELRRMFVTRRRNMSRETILSFFDPDPEMNIVPILSSIMVATLVTHGREDRLIDFAAAEYIAARIPDARLFAFEGKGHSPMFSATEEFCEVLKQFVRTGEVGARVLAEATVA